jgi:hypothetical protein
MRRHVLETSDFAEYLRLLAAEAAAAVGSR